ncbi:Dna2/Cas4 domain-containing protein [Methanotorris igneus]|uniref:Uncharacterized protein n=1 Tax=Methanotorris igneus (strain DSM 5666 / JCM 11834 / Kol 5) TaxID=880724 RepID=F6BCA5_METIK|nr:Dna2/Cas4 domain-containing protein [Methanotorris igneus]AEF97311.1 hypothetical protein Metig_1779 [Methanotorris igneus Kol 5]
MFKEFDMYPYVRRNLRKRYPASKGWVIKERERRGSYEPDFIVERRTKSVIERIVVEVKATPKITENHIKQINRYAKCLAGANVKIKEKILVVPSGAKVSKIPPDIKIHYSKKFSHKKKKSWKKRKRKYRKKK